MACFLEAIVRSSIFFQRGRRYFKGETQKDLEEKFGAEGFEKLKALRSEKRPKRNIYEDISGEARSVATGTF